jgi:DnaK suppressor protein
MLLHPYTSRQYGTTPTAAIPAGLPQSGVDMAKKLTKKQIEHLLQRLLRERDRALRSLGQFDELAKESAEQNDSDSYSYSDHMADLGTDAMEREKMLLFASKEGRYLYRIEEALRRLYKEPDRFGFCHACQQLIEFDRLDALPHARYCIDCKLKEEQDAA